MTASFNPDKEFDSGFSEPIVFSQFQLTLAISQGIDSLAVLAVPRDSYQLISCSLASLRYRSGRVYLSYLLVALDCW